MNEIIIIWL